MRDRPVPERLDPRCTHRLTLDPDSPSPLDQLPAKPGVVMLQSADGHAVQISATGDTRKFCTQRLDPDAQLGPQADLRPLTRTILAATVGSALEADWLTLEFARERMPQTYRILADRWRSWFLQFDPDAEPPVWRKTDLRDTLDRADPLPPHVLLGPLSDKNAVGQLGELLDDAFELCRYPRELPKAPHGSPCAYKDMGCPAACDGSETLTAYARRAELAHDFVRLTHAGEPSEADAMIRAQMQDAAGAQRFEEAARLKQRLDRLDDFGKRAFRAAGSLERLAVLAVLPSERVGHARLLLFVAGEMVPIADVASGGNADGAADSLEAILERVGQLHAEAEAFPLTRAAVERLGLVCRYWFRPESKQRQRRATFFDGRQGWPSPRDLGRAIGFAAAASEAEEFTETDLSG